MRSVNCPWMQFNRGGAITIVTLMLSIPLRKVLSWLAAYWLGGHYVLLESDRSGRPRKVNGEMMDWLYEPITLGDTRQLELPFCL
jgi:transposase